MNDGTVVFDVLLSIERHISALRPLLPKKILVCIGEYPIKILFKEPGLSNDVALPILVEKSSNEIYNWLPKSYSPYLVLGFEEKRIDSHFWYNVMPTILNDNSIIDSLKKTFSEKLREVIIFSSVWDGIGSAVLPALIGKFKTANMDSLSIAVLPSKIQPTDASFNAYAALKMCSVTDGATVLLLERDQMESYEGVDRRGQLIKGNIVASYLLDLLLAKDSLVEEISELSRTFGIKLFTPIVVTGASYNVYGSIENMLNTAMLKPFLTFDLSTSSLLYVVMRIPASLKEELPRGKVELAITNWFKKKTSLQSIYITEPIYVEDMTDRIDAVLFVGGFDINKMLSDLEQKVLSLKSQAVEKGIMTEDGSFVIRIKEKPDDAKAQIDESPQIIEEPQKEKANEIVEIPKATDIHLSTVENASLFEVVSKTKDPEGLAVGEEVDETQTAKTKSVVDFGKTEDPKPLEKPKRRRTKKLAPSPPVEEEKVNAQQNRIKPRAPRSKKAQ
jgi:hypothetical protein